MHITDETRMYIGNDDLIFITFNSIEFLGSKLEDEIQALNSYLSTYKPPFAEIPLAGKTYRLEKKSIKKIIAELETCLEYQEVFAIYCEESPHPALEFAAKLRENKRGDYDE